MWARVSAGTLQLPRDTPLALCGTRVCTQCLLARRIEVEAFVSENMVTIKHSAGEPRMGRDEDPRGGGRTRVCRPYQGQQAWCNPCFGRERDSSLCLAGHSAKDWHAVPWADEDSRTVVGSTCAGPERTAFR
jgi:hypothetical protein